MDVRTRCLPYGWYPDSERETQREIESFEDYFQRFRIDREEPRGGLVPHAGWYFSGRLAAVIFHLAARTSRPDVVILFGGHLGHGPGIVYDDRAWDTPLGPMLIDQDLTREIAKRIGARPEGHSTNDNTVEVQLPLVKYFFPDQRLVALRAPHSEAAVDIGRETAEAAREQGKRILVFGSTDLTHYGPNYGFTPQGLGAQAVTWVKKENDRGFIERSLAMDATGLLEHAARNQSACSAGAAAAAVAACQAAGTENGLLVDYYTSYDVRPDDSFVGYAGILY
ncbi:MAG: AmmeMemoRadiSam system protein B [Proteobacteria bacterium]|nr:AmmeMemoRadiSam system protein B [Pseudomonadota bacterium]